MFVLIDKKYEIDGQKLRDARLECGLSQSSFARKYRWSSAYQCRIETGIVICINESTKNAIEKVLNTMKSP